MAGLVPYLHFAGTAREALIFYRDIFEGDLILHTFADLGRTDGPPDAIGHGILEGRVDLFGADAAGDDEPLDAKGMMFSLLGTADPTTLENWFASLALGGTVNDPLQVRPWGAHDGQVTDRYGLRWLIGYEV